MTWWIREKHYYYIWHAIVCHLFTNFNQQSYDVLHNLNIIFLIAQLIYNKKPVPMGQDQRHIITCARVHRTLVITMRRPLRTIIIVPLSSASRIINSSSLVYVLLCCSLQFALRSLHLLFTKLGLYSSWVVIFNFC